MRLRWMLSAAMTLLLAGPVKTAHADSTAHTDSVDAYVKAQMAARHIPGLSITVVLDGEVVKSQGYGLANVKRGVPAAADTIYPIASISKQFTAVGVMLLVQDHTVGLDDPISKYLSALPHEWQSITVRELLNQTSGIPEWVPDPNKDSLLKTYSLTEVAAHAAIKPLAFKPGMQFAYSNTNYNLLAGVIERVSGKPLNNFLRDRLFKPLDMEVTGEYDPQITVSGRSAGYIRTAGTVYNNMIFYNPSILAGAGGLQSTAADLAKWDGAVASGKVLPLPVMAQMWTPPVLPGGARTDYGMGWISQVVKDHRMIWHNGAIPGCMGFSGRFPDDHFSVVILSNMCPVDGFDDNPPFFSLGLGVAKLYLPDLAKEDAGIPDTDPQTAALLKTVSAQIASGTLDESQFTPAFQAALTPEAINPAHALLAPLGPLTSLTLLSRDSNGIAVYRAAYGTAVVNWQIAVDKDHKIAGLRPLPE